MTPELVVLHYTAMESAEAACRALCDPACEVSAHYLIDEAGAVFQLVAEEMRAWHAGAGSWRGRDDVNSCSIGIELANTGHTPFAAAQIDALEELLAAILARWSMPAHAVIGHSDMAPTRKIDPGRRFDWCRLSRQGLAVWPRAGRADPSDFRPAALAFGYPDVADELLLNAFRWRFRPWAKGPLDAVDAGLAQDLAERFAN
ncbi:MAG: N-acetylmuramoyl-L-alanine amidase [Pseudomonadota bacterium]